MRIIIIGAGKVGTAIARQMIVEEHELVIVDASADSIRRAKGALDVMWVEGNGASVSVLLQAGAREADLVIAVSGYDEVNLICCLMAKNLGARHTIARVRNTDYYKDAPILKKEVGLDLVINPEYAAAQEISRILRVPGAFSVESFAGGKVDLIGFRVLDSDGLAGISLLEYNKRFPNGSLVCAAKRGEDIYVPNGSFVPQVGDTLYVIGSHGELWRLFRAMGRNMKPVRTVSVLGGSRIAVYLGWELEKYDVKLCIVERDAQRCLELSEKLPKATVICGDGTDHDLIEGESIFDADGFVSLTGRDEENLLMAMSARREGVSKVLTKMTRPNYMELVADTGIDSVISPKDIIANRISSYVRGIANSQGSAVESLHKLLGGKIEAVEFTAGAKTAFLDTPLRQVPMKKGILVAAIVRGGRRIVPDGNTKILAGDRVIVVAKSLFLDDLNDILERAL